MSLHHDAQATHAWRLLQSFVFDNDRRAEVGAALGMSFSRARLLWRLESGAKTMSELAVLLQTDPPYVTVIVDDLEERGLLHRYPHPKDRRARLVELTAEGGRALARARRILDSPPAGICALEESRLEQLTSLLGEIAGSRSGALAGPGGA